MKPLDSKLAGMELSYADFRERLEGQGFSLGGNWDYTSGCFDRSLDEEKQTVWLRIPFEVTHGMLDDQSPEPATRIRIQTPFVLNHQYQEGEDDSADFALASAFTNQFQSPEDPDAAVEDTYVRKANEILRTVEAMF